MSQKKTSKALEQLDFEDALNELEALVEQLEGGDLGLSDSLKHFEKGVRLSRRCHSLLDDARQKVTVLSDPEDESSAADFNLSAETSG